MMPKLRKIYLLIGMLMALLLFDLFGLYYIDQTYQKDDYREEAEKISANQQLVLQELSRSVDVLALHSSFSQELTARRVARVKELLPKLDSNHQWLQQLIQSETLPAGPLRQEMRSNARQAAQGYERLHSLYSQITVPGASAFTLLSNADVSGLETRHFTYLEGLSDSIRQMEGILEGRIRRMNRLLIGSLLLALILGSVILIPLFRQSTQTFQALQDSHAEIKKSAALLRTVIDSSPDYIYVKDWEHRFRLANKALAADLGVTPKELIGKSELDFGIPPDIVYGNPEKGIRGIRTDNEEVLRTGIPMAPKEEKVVVNNQVMYKITTKAPVFDSTGAITGVLGYIHDITERVEMEKRLMESERKYRCLFYENPFPMWIFDPRTLRILEVNEKAIEHYGYTVEEFTSMSILQLRPPQDHILLAKLMQTKDEKKTRFHQGQWTHIKKSGERIIAEITSHRILLEGTEAVLVLAQDITDKVQLEAELLHEKLSHQRQIAKATLDVQEKERSEIGKELHDNVNQILTSVRLQLQYADPDQLAELRFRCVNLVDTAIREIRHLSKSLVPPSLNDIGFIHSIDDMIENLQFVPISFTFTHDVEERYLDRGLKLTVFRILQELTTNIIKHAEASEVLIDLRQQDHQLLLRVTDNGKGFDPAKQGKGIGFQNIINRSEIYGGSVLIQAPPGEGCDVQISFQLEPHSIGMN
ncbi:MAG TPA: PAS domain S-box protein [Flavisolibacter sp.]|jgi:PAS domain S-box-containing protein|nr:PAS domain S-box protein [Flavisolibacter sp.]